MGGARSRILALVAVIAAACTPAEPSPPTTESPSPATLEPALVTRPLVTCDHEHSFDPDFLSAFEAAERDPDGAADVLRRILREPQAPEAPALPETGWTRVVDAPDDVQFVARVLGGWVVVDVDLRAGVWAQDYVGACTPEIVYPDGIHAASWELDPAGGVPGADARSIDVLVTEEACANGHLPGDRLLEPLVLSGDDRVDIAFGVRGITGTGVILCPGNPKTPVTIELEEPLGIRALYDAHLVPPDLVAPAPIGGTAILAEQYRCDTVPFFPQTLLLPAFAENAQDPESAALREFLVGPLNEGFMPLSGWRRLGTSGDITEFAAYAGDPAFNSYVYAAFERTATGWQIARWGDCQPRRVVADGQQALAWWLADGSPNPAARSLAVNVVLDGCNGGPAVDSIESPLVELADGVATVFLTGSSTKVGACSGGGPTPFTIELPEPIEGRRILDGSTLPPRDATTAPGWVGGVGG